MPEKLKTLVRSLCFVLFFDLLAWYFQHVFEEARQDILVCTWNLSFRRPDAACMCWILLRLPAWISLYLRFLRLESGFSVYLFLRQRSYWRVFARTYAGCIGMTVCYYGIGTLIMAVCHGVTLPGVNVARLLWQSGLLRILAEEGLEALSFCLATYGVYRLFQKAEMGFLVVLAGRLLLNFATGGTRPELPVQMTVNFVIIGLTYKIAFRDFPEKIGET